ncbi:MAG TPA: hypothetical protein VJL35_01860 [Gemmatimonadaceae bacterium]|nr:hypothetical protein [Gemmatimonadaceae bacterium]
MLPGYVKRVFAALFSFWFLLVVIEPEAVHSCPVHTAAAASESAHSHHMHGASKGDTGKSSHATCSCPGDCAASAFGAIPVDAPVLTASINAASSETFRVSNGRVPDRVDLLLPFAIGPPASSIG